MKRLEDSTQYSRFFILVLNHPPGEQADGRVEIVAIAEQLRANLRRKIGSRRLSAQKIDDLMLLLLGDEDYLRLPGNEFENLPDVLTEDAALHAEYADALYGCLGLIDELYTYAFLANDTVLVDLIDELSIDDENNLPLTGPAAVYRAAGCSCPKDGANIEADLCRENVYDGRISGLPRHLFCRTR